MLYKIAHIIKERFGFIWDFIEWLNATAFSLTHRKQLKKLPQVLDSCSGEYQFRLAQPSDASALVTFFANQPEEAYEFFKPHDFDARAIKKIIANKAFQTIIVWHDQTIVGYFFLRCFVNGKCFRGKIVDKNWQGRGIAKLMGIVMTKVSQALGMRMFGSISPENYASLASAKASNEIKIHQTLDNGYYYIEFLPKQE